MSRTERHNFDLGEIVTVFNASLGGKFVIEGRATIVKIEKPEDTYRVRFFDDQEQGHKHIWLRYVDPNGQENPEAYLAQLNASTGAKEDPR
jgi:hypothetical protein